MSLYTHRCTTCGLVELHHERGGLQGVCSELKRAPEPLIIPTFAFGGERMREVIPPGERRNNLASCGCQECREHYGNSQAGQENKAEGHPS